MPDGLLYMYDMDIQKVGGWLRAFNWPDGKTYELMIHPAAAVDSLFFGNLTEERLKEYKFAKSADNLEKFKACQIELIRFEDI